jgi:aspartyl-tRNA(Asn)/glutamyl-tRNA(Gln) amidotransferase subunit A
MIGTYVLSAGYFDAYYLKAQRVREEIQREFAEAFKICDLILSPSTLGTAFKFGEKISPLDMYLEDKFLAGPSLAGLPAVSVPAGFVGKLPLGIQLIGNKDKEELILSVAKELAGKVKNDLKKIKI